MQERIGDTVDAVTNVNKVMSTQTKNVKETEESFKNIFGGVDSLDTLLSEVEDKNATMVEKKEVILSSMTDLSAGIEETSASTLEVTDSAHNQAEVISKLVVLTNNLTEYSERLSEKLNHFICE